MKHLQVKVVQIEKVDSPDLKHSHLEVTYQETYAAILGVSVRYSCEINPKKSIGENVKEHLEYIRVEYDRRENVRAIRNKRKSNLKTVQNELLNKEFMIKVVD